MEDSTNKFQETPKEYKEMCFRLRHETGMGLLTCKRCLESNLWDYDEAKKNYKQYQWDGRLIRYSN